MKKLFKILGILVLILVVLLVVLMFSLGQIVEKAVPTVGSKILGVPVSVEKVRVRVLAGKLTIQNLVLGNPEGFHTDYAFKVGKLTVDMDLRSAFSDKVLIHKILIDAPEITYELGLKGSNLGKLQKQVAGDPKPEEPKPEAAPEATGESAGKKVVITELIIQHGRVNLSATALGGSDIPIPLPVIKLENMGEDEGGASIPEIVEHVLAAVFHAATGLVKGSGVLLGKGVKMTGDLAIGTAKLGVKGVEEGAKLATDAAGKGVELAGDAVGKGAELAGDAVGKTGELIGSGAGAIGKGAGSAAKGLGNQSKKLMGGMKGMLKKKEE